MMIESFKPVWTEQKKIGISRTPVGAKTEWHLVLSSNCEEKC